MPASYFVAAGFGYVTYIIRIIFLFRSMPMHPKWPDAYLPHWRLQTWRALFASVAGPGRSAAQELVNSIGYTLDTEPGIAVRRKANVVDFPGGPENRHILSRIAIAGLILIAVFTNTLKASLSGATSRNGI